jgi:hypothetical protein
MLQAFIVRGYQGGNVVLVTMIIRAQINLPERNPINVRKLTRPLFVDKAGKPKPVDIRELNSVCTLIRVFISRRR